MENKSSSFFNNLKTDLTAYAELKIELLKLNTYERVGKVASILSYGLILLFFVFFTLLFIFLAVGFFLGDWFESKGLGFTCVAILYLMGIVTVILYKEQICERILNEVIRALVNDEKKHTIERDNETTNATSETDF